MSAIANTSPEVIFFYAFGMSFLLPYLAYFLIRKQGALAIRCSVIILLLHLSATAIWLGEAACMVYVLILITLGSYEVLSKAFQPSFIFVCMGLSVLMVLFFGLFDIPYWWVFWIIGVSAAFGLNPKSQDLLLYTANFSFLVVGMGGVALVKLLMIHPAHWVVLMLSVQMNDAFSMLAGKRFGRHRPFPDLSPNKSIEGYLGGALGLSMVLLAAVKFLPLFSDYSIWRFFMIGILLWMVINFGDLLFSRFKRKHALKDFSRLLPEHGGVLDRYDSLLTVAPFWWLITIRLG